MEEPKYQRQRADGMHSWRIRPYVGSPPRRVSVSFTTPTKSIKAARKAANAAADQAERDAAEHDEHRGTVDQLLTDWLERIGPERSPRTIQGYRASADVVRAHIGHLEASAVTLDDISAMYAALRRNGTSEAMLLEHHRRMQAAFEWGHLMGRIPAVPPLKRVKPKHRPPEIDLPPIAAMAGALLGLPRTEWARAVSIIALTGMRRGEVVGIKLADVGGDRLWVRHSIVLDDGAVHVRPYPKSGLQREIEVGGAGRFLLEQREHVEAEARRLRRDVPEWLFPAWESWRWRDPRNPNTLTRAWTRYRARVGADDVRVHDLRHLYATIALLSGRSPADVAYQLGHTDVATTLRIYAHATRQGGAAVAASVADALGFGAQPLELDTPAV